MEQISPEEVRSDPLARQEAEKRAGDLNPEFVAEQIQAFKEEAENGTRDERDMQRQLFDAWEGYRDFSGKEAWQNKIAVEKPFAIVEQATAQIQRALLDSPEFIKIDGPPATGGVPLSVWENYLRYALQLTAFAPKFIDAVQMSFITNVSSYIKPRWKTYQITMPDGRREDASFLHIAIIPPWRVFRDLDSVPREPWSGSFLIHSDWIDKGVLSQRRGVINMDKVVAGGQISTGFTEPEDRGRQREWKRSKYRNAVVADEFWGDLRNENGEIVLPDATATIVGRTLVIPVKTIPIMSIEPTNGRRRWPLVAFSPFTHPLRFEGRGILQQSWRLTQFYENVFNISGDALNFSVFSGLQGDLSRLANPTDTAIRPSKFWGLKSGVNPDALKIVESGRVDVNAVLAYLQNIDQVLENASFVNSFVVGLPGYRSDITKGEVQLKTAQSLSIFDRMGKAIELGGQQVVSLIYDLLVQYTDETTVPVIGTAIPLEILINLVVATPEQRWRQMRADMQVRFVGISQALQRDQQLARGMQMAAILADPNFAGLTENPGDLLKELVDLVGFKDLLRVRSAPMPQPVQPGVPGEPEIPNMGLPANGTATNIEPPRAPTVASILRRGGGGGPSLTLDRTGG